MGCPVRKVTVGNAGAALLRDLPRVRQIFKAMRRNITRVPFTVKMRWDWDDAKGTALDVALMAQDEGLDAVALHARTREQGYSGKASWEMIAMLKEKVSIPVIGNGDVRTPADAVRMKRETGCDAVMIGRGLIGDPWLMRDCLRAFDSDLAPGERPQPAWEDRREVMLFHARCMVERRGPQGLKLFRKHAVAYLRGVRGGKRVRNLLMSVESLEELAELLATEPEADCVAGNA
jgi:nifR3 family TIM-barrel protein